MRTRVVVLALLALAACRPKEQGSAPADSTAMKSAAAPAAPATPPVVTVRARDFAFEGPSQIPSGVTTFNLMNEGTTFHHMVIARLDSGKTLADLQQAIIKPGPPPVWFVAVGGPNATDPKGVSNATLDLPPGNYILLCFVDVPGGRPHYSRGMISPLTVTPSSGPSAAALTPDVVATVEDYKFTLSKPLVAGKQTIEVHIAPGQPHELEILKLAPGKTVKDLEAWGAKPQGPPPFSGIGGIAPAGGGSVASFTVDLTPGNYVMMCFLPDTKDRKPHFLHGMIQEFKVS
ncbi:MAG TPA: hypothetical protein VEI06_12765 [Gemmatimonadaceae bacterium]|nr:hypothetical protein [Gemmatimonadaceae bacterium]